MTPEAVFGRVLQQLRRERHLSQERLAALSGVHRTYISLLERGLNSPSLSMLFQLTGPLGVTPSSVLLQVEQELSKSAQAPA